MAAKATTPHWRYRFLFTVLAPLLVLHSIWQAWKNRDRRLALQRLGLNLPQHSDRPLWLHMASVGEVNAAVPLIQELQQRHPALPIMVSTVTATGAAMAQKKLPGITHCYLPLDFAYATRTLLKKMRPRCAVIMETELWPQLYHQCGKQQVPLLIVNGRLSQRTLNRPAWVHAFYQRALANVTKILARSEKDAQRFVQLGATAEQVSVVENIKFAAVNQNAIEAIKLPRPYVVAASTHDDEELQISREWLASELCKNYLLVIVPRHPVRKETILKQLRPLNAPLAVRSANEVVTSETEIYLADTFGELQQFIAGSELVCMGGSLIPRGGQNLIEVARQGKVALFGPHMENFEDECDLLLEQQAAFQVNSAAELIEKMVELLAQPELLQEIGQRAHELVAAKADVAARYAEALEPYL
jgi:3-deoxy-D-manno-octulosonic-acid transferase